MPAIAEERERPRWAATSGWLTPAEEIFRHNNTGLWGMTLRLSGARPIGLDDPLQVGNAFPEIALEWSQKIIVRPLGKMLRLRCVALNMTGRVIASNGRSLAWITF